MTKTGDILRIAELAVDGMRVIQRATKLGGEKAEVVLAAIGALASAFLDAEAGTISIEDLEAEVEKLASSIVVDVATRNATKDAKLAEKFGVKKDD